MPPPLTIAAAQCRAVEGNIDTATRHMVEVLTQSDRLHVDIICFPECYLTGYYHDTETIRKNALSLSDSVFVHFLEQIRKFNSTIIVGLIERDEEKIYNTAVVIENGQLIGKYHKAHLNEEKYTAGKAYPVFIKKGVRYGINICNDANFPASAAELKNRGAEIIFYPLNNQLPIKVASEWKEKSRENLINRARENNCWVVSSDVVCEDETEISYGCSLIVDPTGAILKNAAELQEELIFIECSS